MTLTLGSLFDGSGGFPLAGICNGIKPIWSSEIEKYPMAVTEKRLPWVKQLGDITKINGAEIDPVDIICGGSPCQDLSVAGKRAGIHDGERSNLFFEMIRVIKEMRDSGRTTDNGRAGRWVVWENVPGAFSSNKGEDFRCVLQAFCDLGGQSIEVPMPPKGKWHPAGSIVGDGGFSLCWRVFDAQYWGVPQRRKRIYLTVDLGNGSAGDGEILFEREGLPRDSQQSLEAWQGVAGSTEERFVERCEGL